MEIAKNDNDPKRNDELRNKTADFQCSFDKLTKEIKKLRNDVNKVSYKH